MATDRQSTPRRAVSFVLAAGLCVAGCGGGDEAASKAEGAVRAPEAAALPTREPAQPAPEARPSEASAPKPETVTEAAAGSHAAAERRERGAIEGATLGDDDGDVPAEAVAKEATEAQMRGWIGWIQLADAKMRGPWLAAMLDGDWPAYKALVGSSFLGRFNPDDPYTDSIDDWIQKLNARYEGGVLVELGPARVRILDPPGAQVMFDVIERRGEGEECQEIQRELAFDVNTLPGEPVTVDLRRDSADRIAPCRERKSAEIAAVHETLRRALEEGRSMEALRHMESGIDLFRYGLRLDDLQRTELDPPEPTGADTDVEPSPMSVWLRGKLLATEAEIENTTSFGGEGWVMVEGARFHYKRQGARGWRLTAVDVLDQPVPGLPLAPDKPDSAPSP